jgi:hypothetical protein
MKHVAGSSRKLSTKIAALLSSVLALALGACSPGSTTTTTTPTSPNPIKAVTENAGRKIGDANRVLMDSLTKPTSAFHYSYQAQKNINPKFPMTANSKPEVGAVSIEADISPDDLSVATVEGKKKTETKAKKSDQLNWAMAQLSLTTSMLGPGMDLAFASPVAESAGTEAIGTMTTNKYSFDTAQASATQKTGIAMAQGLLGGKVKIGSLKGTCWVDQASGKLVKYTIDSELSDQSGNSWKEHEEMLITPK